MNDSGKGDRRLTDAFRAIAENDARLGASAAVEAKVMAAFDDVARARQRRTRRIVGALASPRWLSRSRPALSRCGR
jgi:hypothetical protein